MLYWYLNERSRESQNKIKLSDVDEIFTHPNAEKNKKFKIVNNKNHYSLKNLENFLRKSQKKEKSTNS